MEARLRRLLAAPSAWVCLLFLAIAALGPPLVSTPPDAIDLPHAYELPSSHHLLGTADNGIDLLSALVHGARLAAVISLSVVTLSLVIGGSLGALAGMRGGVVESCVMALCDLLQAFPAVLLNIALLSVVARPSVEHVVLSLSVSGWVLYARLARAEVLSLREREFVAAARALGASESRVLFAHLVPNLFAPLLVQATTNFGGVILMEATLSFLGLGPARAVSWGALLDQGSSVLLRFPHVALLSGFAIAAVVLGFNLAGDVLREVLDPRLRGRR
jgi:peptide/nickel transport system permease protein